MEGEPKRVSDQDFFDVQVSVVEAKRNLSELCLRAGYGRQKIIITKHGQPIAAIISVEDLKRYLQLETEDLKDKLTQQTL